MGETEAGEDIEKSDGIASVTECAPVNCVPNVCCSPSPLLDIHASSLRTWEEDPLQDSEYVEGEPREEGASRVGVLAAGTGDGCEMTFERVSVAASWVVETCALLLDTTLMSVTLFADGCSPTNDRCTAISFSRA